MAISKKLSALCGKLSEYGITLTSRYTNLYELRASRQYVHHDQMRSIKIGCGIGFKTFTTTIEDDHDLSNDLTR